jgi:hypothetical protein
MSKIVLRSVVLAFASIVVMSLVSTALAADPNGKPKKMEHGVFVWLSNDGIWHFRVVSTKDGGRIYAGTIHSIGAPITGATGVDTLHGGDFWQIDKANNAIHFRLHAMKPKDQINLILKGHARELKFNIQVDDKNCNPKWIHIGRNSEHPESSAFTLSGK